MMDALNRIVEESGMEHTATQNQHAPTKRPEEMRLDSGALGQPPSQDRPLQAHVAGVEETAREEGVVGSYQARSDKGASEQVNRSKSPSMRLDPASESRQSSSRGVLRATCTEHSTLGHLLVVTGRVTWCCRCSSYTEGRVGSRLLNSCSPVVAGEGGARTTRLRRLRGGRHPLPGEPLI